MEVPQWIADYTQNNGTKLLLRKSERWEYFAEASEAMHYYADEVFEQLPQGIPPAYPDENWEKYCTRIIISAATAWYEDNEKELEEESPDCDREPYENDNPNTNEDCYDYGNSIGC